MYWTITIEGGPKRVNHAAVALNDQIYSFGGYCSGELYDGSQPVDVHVLDTGNYRWRKLTVRTDNNESKTTYPSVSQNNWPYQRYGHTVVEYNGKAYLWGGRNDEFGACSKMYCFDPEAVTWSVVPSEGEAPPARDGHSAVVVDDLMFMFGGFEEDSQRFSQETFAYNFKRRKWYELKTTGELPQWRDFHTACVINKKMYIFGGRSDLHGAFHSSRDYYSDVLKVLNLKTGRWEDPKVTGDCPCGRRSHSAWVRNNKMYIFGGYLGTENRHLNELHEFDPATSCWRRLKPFGTGPSPRRRQCVVVVGERVFLFGGTMPSNSKKMDPVHSGLCDLSDLHVLDYAPTLKDLAANAVIRNGLNERFSDLIPSDLKQDLRMMTQPNKITLTRYDG
uniref:Kelch domain-containing protein family protein n=1 Tax=Wuchereria bancrofti TaxID=6293 RepID=A0AAF5PSP2_WUCBA